MKNPLRGLAVPDGKVLEIQARIRYQQKTAREAKAFLQRNRK